jgi:hypothetical protein
MVIRHMANRDIIARMSAALDEYEAGRMRPLDVERAIHFNMEALEALPYARIKEAKGCATALSPLTWSMEKKSSSVMRMWRRSWRTFVSFSLHCRPVVPDNPPMHRTVPAV